MSPFEQAAAVYEREACARSFESDLFSHFLHGYVVSIPEAFALARRVRHDWPEERLQNPDDTDPEGDCWWIWLLAGELSAVARWLPFDLPWIGYERDNRPIVRPASRVLSLAFGD